MMGFFKKVFKGVVDTALLPIDIAKDVVTLGGAITDEDEPYTVQRARKIKEDAEDAYEELEKD